MADPNENSSLAESGEGADSGMKDTPAGEPVKDCIDKTWIAIELKDEDGNPVPDEEYRIELPNGKIVEGKLDANGTGGVNVIDPGNCKVTFPKIHGEEWRPA